ncbi:MAG: DinB family protein [Candidatus Dormibacteraeota bacterium]|nr:DinB family protein [Candidatus Dormibacteraeota bacterium]
MTEKPQSIAPFYEGWRLTNERLVQKIGSLTPEQLALRPAPDLWPIWATAGHLAGARVYWLCGILKEPGARDTPFPEPLGDGWEDDPNQPRRADELVLALESTWKVVQGCLERWTYEMLQQEFRREFDGNTQIHTRQSVLMRLITHDAVHVGEISQTLGMNGISEPDLWTGRGRTLTAPA